MQHVFAEITMPCTSILHMNITVSLIVATISFSKSNYKVIENEGVVKINLLRSGNTSTEAVVLIGTHPYRGSATG